MEKSCISFLGIVFWPVSQSLINDEMETAPIFLDFPLFKPLSVYSQGPPARVIPSHPS